MSQLVASSFVPAGSTITDRQRFDVAYAAGVTDARAGRPDKHYHGGYSLDPGVYGYRHGWALVHSQARLESQGWTIVVNVAARESFDAAWNVYLEAIDRKKQDDRRARRRAARRARIAAGRPH
jgi:hypothetical protein